MTIGLAFFNAIDTIINLYILVIIIGAVLSWLIVFNVIHPSNQIVRGVMEFTYRLTEPALRPIRNRLPNMGGIDISPIILIVGLILVRNLLAAVLI